VQLNVGILEAGRALATPNNILFINKLQREYYAGGYSVFEKIIDMKLDFYTLQNVLNNTPTLLPDDVELSYQIDSLSYDYPFFNKLFLEYETLSVKLEVKRASFNIVPDVSVVIPKNYTRIEIND